jgi:hypothetical protein
MILLREKDSKNQERFLKTVDVCNSFSSETKLRYIFNGKEYKTYSAHDEIISAYKEMTNQYHKGRGLDKVFMLTTAKEDPFFVLGPKEDPYNFSDDDGLEFSFYTGKPILKPEGYLSFRDSKEFFIATINSYEAYTGYIHDSYLEEITTFAFVQNNIKAQLPRDQWKHIPAPEIIKRIPSSIAESLSRLTSPEQFNIFEVPQAIYWFNYWNKHQVENVGEDKIKAAPCEVIEKQKNGGYILITQKENFDALNNEHLQKLARIYDHLNLYEVQQKMKFQ